MTEITAWKYINQIHSHLWNETFQLIFLQRKKEKRKQYLLETNLSSVFHLSYNHICHIFVLLAELTVFHYFVLDIHILFTASFWYSNCSYLLLNSTIKPSTAKSERSLLQLATGVHIVFQIFILYFYLLHYVNSINISSWFHNCYIHIVDQLILLIHARNKPEIKMSPESVIVHHERHSTQYVPDICDISSSWLIRYKQNNIPVMCICPSCCSSRIHVVLQLLCVVIQIHVT